LHLLTSYRLSVVIKDVIIVLLAGLGFELFNVREFRHFLAYAKILVLVHGNSTRYWYRPHSTFISIIPLKLKRRPLYLKIQSVPRCKHFSSGL